jgi:hypothetical protein
MSLERGFFEWVFDAFEGFAGEVDGTLHHTSHGRGLKVWYDDAKKEHYEAQLIRQADGEVGLEIGFHSEYSKAAENDIVLANIIPTETWRKDLGAEAVVGEFIGNDRWRRISEVWESPDPDDPEAVVEIAARLADYVIALEPHRRA